MLVKTLGGDLFLAFWENSRVVEIFRGTSTVTGVLENHDETTGGQREIAGEKKGKE